MNPHSPDDLFPEVLEAWEAAVSQGDEPRCERILAEYPDLADQLRDSLDCLLMLRQLHPEIDGPRQHETIASLPDDCTPPEFTGVSGIRETAVKSLGRFQIRRELGRGGCGVVYLAWDPELERDVALKVPRVELLSTENGRMRFAREARAAARLDHPNIAAVFDSGVIGPLVYLAATYCPGPNLGQWQQEQGDPIHWRDAVRIALRLTEAVQHAHARGVLHRDLKPANVVMVPADDAEPPPGSCSLSGGCFVPRLTDFGLALIHSDAARETQESTVLGTPAYMAPEQTQGNQAFGTGASDVYSLGAVLYQLLTGHAPFDGGSPLEVLDRVRHQTLTPPRVLRPDLPLDVNTVCAKCLEKEPSLRYAAAADLGEDLRRILDGQPIRARRVGLLERCWRACRRRPAISSLVAGLILLLLAFAATAWLWQRDHEEHSETVADLIEDIDRSEQLSAADLEDLRREALSRISALSRETKQTGFHRQIALAQETAELIRKCRDRDETFESWQIEAGHGFLFAGQLLVALGRLDKGGQCLLDAATLLQPEGTDPLKDAVAQRALVQVHLTRAELATWSNQLDEALRNYVRAEQLAQDLIDKHAFMLDRISYSRALLGQARLLRRRDQLHDALLLVDRQIRDTAWVELKSGPPLTPTHSAWLKQEADWQPGVLGVESKAALALRLALQISARSRTELATGYDERALLLVLDGQLDEADAQFAKAEAMYLKLELLDLEVCQLGRARHDRYRAQYWIARGQPAAAVEALQKAASRFESWSLRRPHSLAIQHDSYDIQVRLKSLQQHLPPAEVPQLERNLSHLRVALLVSFPEVVHLWHRD